MLPKGADTKGIILHSDLGSQYTSHTFQNYVKSLGLIQSFSRKGNPYDNACIESFHSLLKREWINRFKITDYNHAYKLIFEYIEAFYNTVNDHPFSANTSIQST